MARRWVSKGHQVTVLTCAPNVPHGKVYAGYRNWPRSKETMDGIEVVRIWTFLAANKGKTRRIINYVSYLTSAVFFGLFLKRPDVLIATSPQLFCGLSGAILKRLRGVPFVLEIRDLWPEAIVALGAMRESRTIRLLERCERWMYAQGDHLVAVGNGYRQGLRDRDVAASRISVITNGIDVARQTPRPPDQALLAKYGLRGKFVVGVLGTVGMAAGLEVVLEAAALLRERGDDEIAFLIVGDGAERERLQEMSEQQGLTNVVFTGRRSKGEMPEYVASVDACLVHLRSVPLFATVLPSKMFEAAAMAKPMIVGVPGEAAALLTASGGGVEIESENAEQLVAVARQWADDPQVAVALGERGRRYMIEHFDLDALAKEYEHLLNRMVRDGAKTGTGGA